MKTPHDFYWVADRVAQDLFRKGAVVYTLDSDDIFSIGLRNEDGKSQTVIYSHLEDIMEYQYSDFFNLYKTHFVSEEDFDEYE